MHRIIQQYIISNTLIQLPIKTHSKNSSNLSPLAQISRTTIIKTMKRKTKNKEMALVDLFEVQKKFRNFLYHPDPTISRDDIKNYCKSNWQWAHASWNIQISTMSCPNHCKYCYAYAMACRFKRSQDIEDLTITDKKRVEKGWRKTISPKVYLFPSTHDIFPENMEDYVITAKKLLAAGHDVLCVTKPRPECIYYICENMKEYRDSGRFEFRFTISSINDEILSRWEPGAPSFKDRLTSLSIAQTAGYVTSVSIEPMLEDPDPVIKQVSPFIHPTRGSIWLGKMNMKSAPRVMDIPIELLEITEKVSASAPELILRYQDNPLIFYKGSMMKDFLNI
jgi:hypothetical protein